MVQNGLGLIGDIVDGIRDGMKYLATSEAHINQFGEIAKQLQFAIQKIAFRLSYTVEWRLRDVGCCFAI